MSATQQGMALIISAFTEHAEGGGSCMTLSKGQLTELLQKEFGDCLGNATDHAAVEDLFRILDEDQSGCVDFKEYMSFVTALTMMCCDNITKKH